MTIDTYSELRESKKSHVNVLGYITYVLIGYINKPISPKNKVPFSQSIVNFFCRKELARYKKYNSLFESVLQVIADGNANLNPEKDYSIAKKMVYWFSLNDGYFTRINYYDSLELKGEVKKCLELCYVLEAEFKVRYYESKNTEIKSDKYFGALSLHSKNSLSTSIAASQE